ncbi:DNA damage-binding protein 2 isoform X2 [Hevea brasiliensis]|uniref:DNA damage-binding protein 2 isoform X2 n=1 Tax=Hevea brasiliensis TaxID=3981 RepID=UPI0025E03308|nr:DNA damage-binding protein 2 isoform X2 [Hevea brasiliensis]
MAPQTRRMAFPKVVIERDTDSEQSSSDDEDDVDEEENIPQSESDAEGGGVTENGSGEKDEEDMDSKKQRKVPITISLKKVCKVCKKPGHEAGFKGATYIDCPMKPCFLCKMPGHTTMTCPHRVATEYGVIPAPLRNTHNPLEYVFQRQLRPSIPPIKPAYVIPDRVCCAVIRYHSRRVTCLEFHPTKNNILLSGDKKGQVGVWDFEKVHEKMVYANIHTCIVNNMRFNPSNDGMVYAASSDGTISCTDMETGISSSLLNLNPDGWQGPSSWRMLYGMDVNSEKHVVLIADNFGFLYIKILTTAQDNRLRVWDSVFGNLDSPSREIVHSHDFNRHLTPFRAEWDPKDPSESLAVIGRYISENYNGAALHPIDFIDVSTGQLVAEVMDPNITTISPVNKLHPRDDILASGSSRSLFIWKPKEKSEVVEQKDEGKIVICGSAEKKFKRRFWGGSDDSDDDGFKSKGKNFKLKKSQSKAAHCPRKVKR